MMSISSVLPCYVLNVSMPVRVCVCVVIHDERVAPISLRPV